MVQNILDYLEATAADCPDKPAFEDLEHSYTFAQVLGNAKRIGSALLQMLPQNAPVPVLMEKEACIRRSFGKGAGDLLLTGIVHSPQGPLLRLQPVCC